MSTLRRRHCEDLFAIFVPFFLFVRCDGGVVSARTQEGHPEGTGSCATPAGTSTRTGTPAPSSGVRTASTAASRRPPPPRPRLRRAPGSTRASSRFQVPCVDSVPPCCIMSRGPSSPLGLMRVLLWLRRPRWSRGRNRSERGGMQRQFAWICAGGCQRSGWRGQQCRFSLNLLLLRFFLFVPEIMSWLRFGWWKVIALPFFPFPISSFVLDDNVLVQ